MTPPSGGFGYQRDGRSVGFRPLEARSDDEEKKRRQSIWSLSLGLVSLVTFLFCFLSLPIGLGAAMIGTLAIRGTTDRATRIRSVIGIISGMFGITIGLLAGLVFFLGL